MAYKILSSFGSVRRGLSVVFSEDPEDCGAFGCMCLVYEGFKCDLNSQSDTPLACQAVHIQFVTKCILESHDDELRWLMS